MFDYVVLGLKGYRNQLPDDKILHSSKLKQIADDILKYFYNEILTRNPSTRTRGNNLKLFKKYARTETRKNSFSNRIVDTWNNLPNDLVNSPSVNCFKSRLNKHWCQHPQKFTAKCYNEDRRTQTDGPKEAVGLRMAHIQ